MNTTPLIVWGFTAIFVVLKLLEKIDWSWWWVLSPLWVVLLLSFAYVLTTMVIRLRETSGQRAARLLREYTEALTGRHL